VKKNTLCRYKKIDLFYKINLKKKQQFPVFITEKGSGENENNGATFLLKYLEIDMLILS
jgi:hypothetical protein